MQYLLYTFLSTIKNGFYVNNNIVQISELMQTILITIFQVIILIGSQYPLVKW